MKTRRKYWLKVHLWLGLSVGLILAVIGLSGSALVFWQELDRALYRNGTPGQAANPCQIVKIKLNQSRKT